MKPIGGYRILRAHTTSAGERVSLVTVMLLANSLVNVRVGIALLAVIYILGKLTWGGGI